MSSVMASLDNIADSQNVSAPEFLGNPAAAQALRSKERFKPDALHAHIDGGNTRSDDFLGPLGNSPYVSSVEVPAAFMFWENSTSLLAALSYGLRRIERLFPRMYWQIIDGKIMMPTLEGFILEVERVGTGSETTFHRIREIDVSDVMTAGAILATAGYADGGNLWFTATPAPLVGLPGTNTSTIGYVGPDNAVYSIALDNHVIENGMAVHGKTIYVVTGPSGVEGYSDATGYFYAFQADDKGSVSIAYKEKYSAGSGIKPGGLARGSGATPGLLGQKYVAITDNADEQINLVPNGSGNEASLTTHFDGNTHSVMITNSYNSPTFLDVGDDVNGWHNDLSVAAPGVARIEVTENGDC
ncbi:hypothetical protein FDECE_2710 [Fusarium decemcellulare]|nr:hypothetical protein FDECE_2710 [Fusarium decemcellulare]